jgi:outer membrane protein OmpA-like peptidoglycan-associated protein
MRKVLIIALALLAAALCRAQTDKHYYVVIGAFRIHDNAIRLTEQATKLNLMADYALNEDRQLYYVYALETQDKRRAFRFLMQVKTSTPYRDAWVFTGNLENPERVLPPAATPAPAAAPPPDTRVAPVVTEPKKETPPPVVPVEPEKPAVKKPDGKPFVFNLIDARTKEPVAGQIHVLDGPRATQYQAFRANEQVYLTAPRNAEGVLVINTAAAGYRGETRTFSYRTPTLPEGRTGEGDAYIIDLPLQTVSRGDYVEFNDVRFFANAVILQPESRNELDGMADLLKENPRYRIRVHSHCNGRAAREVITQGSSTDFFALDPAKNKKSKMSDKQLTQLRGELVKAYLESQGIAARRISVRAEGGRTPIYPANSTLAGRNDRIEIQVLKGR